MSERFRLGAQLQGVNSSTTKRSAGKPQWVFYPYGNRARC